jgi:hypothetical protein
MKRSGVLETHCSAPGFADRGVHEAELVTDRAVRGGTLADNDHASSVGI